MLELTESDIQALIDKHNSQDKTHARKKQPVYELGDILKYGMAYLYAKEHMKDGKVFACGEPFSIYRKHVCQHKAFRTKLLEVSEVKRLKESRSTLAHCWTGSNLAILTSDFSLQGYIGEELIFQRQVPDSCTVEATGDKIYLGLYSGDIVHFDPISQSEMTRHCHTDRVTSLSFEGNHLLSSSMDGSIFYRTKIPISSSGVLGVRLIGEDMFFCACGDNSVTVYDHGSIKPFLGHRECIKSLTYNRVGVSTSLDGFAGFLYSNMFEVEDVGCSFHTRVHPHQMVGYGLADITIYDLNRRQVTARIKESTPYADASGDIVVYTVGRSLKIRDLRSAETIEMLLDSRGGEVGLSRSGDMALVCTDESSYVVDLKYI